MSPITSLLLTLLGLHLVEGLYWVRRRALAFRRSGRGFRLVEGDGPFGNARSTFLLLSPWPPLWELYVVEPWPLFLGPEQGWSVPVETRGPDETESEVPQPFGPEQAKKAHADGKRLCLPGLEIGTSSPALARALAELLRAWAEAPPADRLATIDTALRVRHQKVSVEARLEAFNRLTRRLRLYGNLVLLLLFGGTYAYFLVPEFSNAGPYLLLVFGLLLLLSWVEMFVAHRRLYPTLRGDRAMKLLMMVLSFPAAARARAWLARDLLAEFDPLTVAAVLLPEQAFLGYAAQVWRDLVYPRAVAEGSEAFVIERTAAQAQLRGQHAALLKTMGIDALRWETAPPRPGPDAVAYCPRCHAAYREGGGSCSDCPGVSRLPFDSASDPINAA